MTIGERIRSARKAAGMSQEELGRKLGIGKSSVSEWESGKRPLPMDVMEQISEELNVGVPYLMGWNVALDGNPIVSESFSPAALDIARRYDVLPESAQKLISAVVLFESAGVETKNKVISILVDHANEKQAGSSSFSAAGAAERAEMWAEADKAITSAHQEKEA